MKTFAQILIESKPKINNLALIRQERGYDCGPTCLKMLLGPSSPSILQICKMCGSDAMTGTDDVRMASGMEYLGIRYRVGFGKSTQALEDVLARGNTVVLRTLTRGIKHWVVVYGWDGDVFYVNDPWLGSIRYSPKEIEAIWKPRDYFYFEILRNLKESADVEIREMTEADLPVVEQAMLVVFKGILDPKELIYYAHAHDTRLSKIAEVGSKFSGFYLLQEKSILEVVDHETIIDKDLQYYEHKRGLEGVALGVLPEFRGSGVGHALKEVPRLMGFDYIWGYQLKNLKNIDFWLRRRRVIADSGDLYITLEDL